MDNDTKTCLGIFIVMNFLYILTWIVSAGMYFKNKLFERDGFEALDIVMAALWTIILIVGAGWYVGQFL